MARSLGLFEIDNFIAAGGMGEVYSARHRIARTRAAIKVVRSSDEDAELLHEVRTTAALSHPGVVEVLDYGQVTHTEAIASDGAFEEGMLWFAMEFATHGALDRVAPPERFDLLHRVLTDVLDALAHAHAHRLIHRDLKLANILLTERDDGINLLLADFGIARHNAIEPARVANADRMTAPSAGTPGYMAPEQLRGDWRNQGPWTDLYAVGCIAWELATGAPVFGGSHPLEIAQAHLNDEPPPFDPRFDVPPHFEAWLRQLLAKHTRDRFAFAADAIAALGTVSERVPLLFAAADQVEVPTRSLNDMEMTTALIAKPPTLEMEVVSRATTFSNLATIPDSWRAARPARPIGRSAGLGVFALRELPLVGRERERDVLWHLLRVSAGSRTPKIATIIGAEREGKTRLLRWLAHRVEEVGAARSFFATHTSEGAPLAATLRVLQHTLVCQGLSPSQALARLTSHFGESDPTLPEALCALWYPRSSHATMRFETALERYDVVARVLVAESRRRPLVLLLDDAHHDNALIGMCEAFVQNYPNLPVLIVMSIRDDDPHSNAGDATTLRLGPLSAEEHLGVATHHLGLSDELADTLVSAATRTMSQTKGRTMSHTTSGTLSYTLTVFADWITRDVLRATAAGWTMDEAPDLPRDLGEAWSARIDRFVARFALPSRALAMLETAAALGREFVLGEWRAACATLGVGEPDALVEPLLDHAIAQRASDGFAFSATILVELLEARMRQRGATEATHTACAQAVREPWRRARHLLAAGRVEAGLSLLHPAIHDALDRCEYQSVLRWSDWYLAVADASEDETITVRAMRADAWRYLGEAARAEHDAQALVEWGTTQKRPFAYAHGLRILAGLEHARGDVSIGVQRYTEAIEANKQSGDALGVAKSLHGRAWLQLTRSAFNDAANDFTAAVRLASKHGSRLDAVWSRHGLAEADVYLGTPTALAVAQDCVRQFRELGSRSGVGMATTTVANAHRAHGAWDDARAEYEAAIAQLRVLRSQLVSFPLLHRATCELLALASDTDRLIHAVDEARSIPLPPSFRLALEVIDVATRRRALDEHLATIGATAAPRELPLAPVILSRLSQLLPPDDFDTLDALLR